jgi:hypothetical protein
MTFLTEVCLSILSNYEALRGYWKRGVTAVLRLFGVIARAEPGDDDRRLVTDHSGVVTFRQGRNIPGARDQLGAVVHSNAPSFPDT